MTVAEYYRKSGAWQQIGGGTVNPPPPAQLGIIYGSNIGPANTAANLVSEVNPQIIRVYNTPTSTDNVTSWANSPAGPVPDTIGVSWTVKPDVSSWQTGSANYSSEVAKWKTILGAAPANQLIWFGLWHEPYDNMVEGSGSTFTLAQWKNMYKNFRADVIDFVNSTRTYPILLNCNLHGESATGHLIGGSPSINSFLTSDVLDVLHEVTLDTYNTAHLPAWDDWMTDNGGGKRWGVWETGYSLNQNPTDAEVFDRMKYFVETQYPSLSSPVSYVCWFNSDGSNPYNAFTGGANPEALAYWKALCESCPKATPEVYFNGYNP